ncbi:GIY-YIG nuclease family protein [Patescibacteria group bacterium]|nr:GIY-YIG nuclease family protein [Patescibacteria group bacterium]
MRVTGRYFVYILTNVSGSVLYTGITNDLARRLEEHRSGNVASTLTSRYRTTKLVWYAVSESAEAAIMEEKRIKGGSRMKKLELVRGMNPSWRDLSSDL